MFTKKLGSTVKTVRRSSVFAPENIFKQENIKKTMSRFSQIQPVQQRPKLPLRKAAVLVPLCVVHDRVSLLYTLRAPNLKSHRGQVSFPGGMEDVGDQSLEETATRETREELGITGDKIQVWGRGNPINRGATSVLPVIGVLKINIDTDLNVNRSEVEEVFTVPLEVLCHPKLVTHTRFRPNYSLPVYIGGKRRIWGLTAIITHLFLTALFSEDVYDHKF